MYLLSWDLTEDLKQSYDNLYKHASHQLYAFKHGDNDNLELNFQGYISNEPGIILDITNCFSFTQSEIEAYKTVFLDYGASKVEIGMNAMSRTVTIYIYYYPKKEQKNASFTSVYKMFSWQKYIPLFVWIYLLLIIWKPNKYLL